MSSKPAPYSLDYNYLLFYYRKKKYGILKFLEYIPMKYRNNRVFNDNFVFVLQSLNSFPLDLNAYLHVRLNQDLFHCVLITYIVSFFMVFSSKFSSALVFWNQIFMLWHQHSDRGSTVFCLQRLWGIVASSSKWTEIQRCSLDRSLLPCPSTNDVS